MHYPSRALLIKSNALISATFGEPVEKRTTMITIFVKIQLNPGNFLFYRDVSEEETNAGVVGAPEHFPEK